jgi:hypothetical protein
MLSPYVKSLNDASTRTKILSRADGRGLSYRESAMVPTEKPKRSRRGRPAPPLLVLFGGLVWLAAARLPPSAAAGQDGFVYLPLVRSAAACVTGSGQGYSQGPAFQHDLDNPVRPAWNHPDKNLALRGYTPNTSPGLQHELIDYGSDDPNQPPQLATLFSPAKVPPLIGFYQVYDWIWADSPNPGIQGDPTTSPPVTAMGLATTPGEAIRVPVSDYDIGGGMEVIVLFADEDSVTLRYAREDSAGSAGYTIHVDRLCTDRNLLAKYRALDDPSGPRYVFVPPENRPYGYDLPQLPAGQPVGVSQGNELVIAIADSGAFMDTRSCNEWWQIRPGYGGSCPPA